MSCSWWKYHVNDLHVTFGQKVCKTRNSITAIPLYCMYNIICHQTTCTCSVNVIKVILQILTSHPQAHPNLWFKSLHIKNLLHSCNVPHVCQWAFFCRITNRILWRKCCHWHDFILNLVWECYMHQNIVIMKVFLFWLISW